MDVRIGRDKTGTPIFIIARQGPAFQRIFGAYRDKEKAIWTYPAFYPVSDKVLHDFSVFNLSLSESAQTYVNELQDVSNRLKDRILPSGFTFQTTPYDHQITGLCHVYYNLRAALHYKQGLGKSKIITDLARLLKFTGAKPITLMLGPKISVKNLGREINLHSGRQLTWTALLGTKAQKLHALDQAISEKSDFILATYDTAKILVDSLIAKLPYSVLVCDESHNVKNWQSKRTQAVYELAQKANRRIVMTGTPTEGNPLHLYGPYKILADCFMPEVYWNFKKTFTVTRGANSPIIVGFKNLHVINERVSSVSDKKTKEECLDLPTRTFVNISYELSKVQKLSYNQIVMNLGINPAEIAQLVNGLQTGVPEHVPAIPPAMDLPHRAAALVKLIQITSGFIIKNEKDPEYCDKANNGEKCHFLEHCVANDIEPRTPRCQIDKTPWPKTVTKFDENPKLEAIIELLEGIEEKTIVWCTHLLEMSILSERLTALGIKHVRVDGSTKNAQAQIDAFNEDETVRVYIGQVTTGIGITLNAASYVIYNSMPYSLTQYDQCLDRNHRIGQTKKVTVYRLVGQDTLDGAIVHLLDHKVDVDKLLTSKIECAICPHSVRCLARGIEPFDTGCIHPRKVGRPVIKAKTLPIYYEDEHEDQSDVRDFRPIEID